MYSHVREVMNESWKVNTPKVKRIQEILKENQTVIHKIVFSNLAHTDALHQERQEIRRIGRADLGTGPLLNLKTGDERPIKKMRPVCQYNKFGDLLHTFSSTLEAAEALNIKHASSLANAVRGRVPSYKGFLWAYQGEPIQRPLVKVVPVYQWSLDGNLINRYENASHAARDTGCAVAEINQQIKRKGTCHNMVFSRTPHFPGIIRKSKKHEKYSTKVVVHVNTGILYASVTMAAMATKHNIGTISAICKGRRSNVCGDVFKYYS